MSHYTHYPLRDRDISQVGGSFTLYQLITISKRIPGASFTPVYSLIASDILDGKDPAHFERIFEQQNAQELPYFIVYPLDQHDTMMTILSVWLSMPSHIVFKSRRRDLV